MAKLKRRLLSTSVQSLLITVVVVLVLVLVGSPIAQAITFSYPQGIPGTGTLGSTYTFQVQINITDADLLPLTSVDLRIYNATSPSTYTLTCTSLPIPATAGGTASDTYSSGDFGTVAVSALTGTNWVYAYSASRYGYGYGYQTGSWETPQSFPGGYGYGYGYNTDYTGPTWIRYSVSWVSPSTWPTGTYNVEVVVYGNGVNTALTDPETRSFSLSAAAPGVPAVTYGPAGGPGAEGPPFRPGVTDLSDIVDEEGVFTESTSIEIGRVELTIPEDTTGLTEEGEPLSEINVTEMAEPPAPPEDANVIGLTYDLGPDGATFNPPITITFTYDEADIPEGVDEEDLVIAIWDEDAGEWVVLEDVTVDPVTNTISASVSHFTAFTVLAFIPAPPPAPPAPPPAPPAPPPAPPVITAPVVPPPAPPVVTAPVVPPPVPVVPTPPVPAPTPWWILVIIAVATIVVVGVVLWFFEFRRV